MPSTITHEFHYRDVYEQTSKQFQKSYPLETYQSFSVGAQGHDALFFYNFWDIPGFMARREKVLELENNNFRDLCAEYVNSIHKNGQRESQDVKLLLYGYILHHILDSYEHPYIIYRTEKEKMHEPVESFIDEYMIQERTNLNPHNFPVHTLIQKLPPISDETKIIISEAFGKIYGLKNFGDIYIHALRQVRLFLRLFRYDPTGIKKHGYNIIDSTHLFNLTFAWLSYKTQYDDFEKYLNESKEEWSNPIDATITSTETFMELYEVAVKEGARIISELETAIMDQAPLEDIMNIVPDRSAVHGLECGKTMNFTNLK